MKTEKFHFTKIANWLVLALLLMALMPQAGCAHSKDNGFEDKLPNDSIADYESIRLTLPLAFNLPFEVRETSGLVFYNGRLWTHNDSNHLPVLYAIDTTTAEVVQRLTVSNAENIDWEEITMDDTYLYIGDFGNNRGTRTDLGIYRIRLDQMTVSGDASIEAEYIAFSYPDQTSFGQSNTHNFDCEAFIAYNNSLYLFSKNRGDQQTKLYQLPAQPGTYVAELMGTFNSKGLITGSSLHENGNELVLVGYVNQIWTPFIWVLYDFEAPDYFGGQKLRIDLIDLVATQIEGVCYYEAQNLYISSEQRPGASPRVFHFSTEPFTDHGTKLAAVAGKSPAILWITKELLAEKKLQLNVFAPADAKCSITISNAEGQIVHTEAVDVNMGANNWFLIDLQHHSPGSYEISYITTQGKDSRIIQLR